MSLKKNIAREGILLPYELPDNMVIRMVENENELETALKILHDAYVEYNYMETTTNQLRLNIYHALPGTNTAIVLIDGKIIGTIAAIMDGVFGLPIGQIFDIKRLRKKFNRIYEISGLAIHQDYRREKGKILFMMVKYIILYAKNHLKSECILATVNPRQQALYDDILLFENIADGTVTDYEFVKNAPALGRFLNLETVEEKYKKTYSYKNDDQHNFYRFMFKVLHSQLQFPTRDSYLCTLPLLSAKSLEKYFIKDTTILDELSKPKLYSFLALYLHKEYHQVLAPYLNDFESLLNREPRFYISLEGQLLKNQKTDTISYIIAIVNISVSGIFAILPYSHPIEKKAQYIKIPNKDRSWICVKVKPMWLHDDTCGFIILDKTDEWYNFVSEVKKHYLKNEDLKGKVELKKISQT